MSNSDWVIDCDQLSRHFTQGGRDIRVLQDVMLQVAVGERVSIIGQSGCGKSTLLQLLGGLDKASAGRVSIVGQDLSKLSAAKLGRLRNKHLGFVYQFHYLLPEFSALENVAMPLFIRGSSSRIAKKEARVLLEKMGLGDRITHKPSELSGGERQRAAIARALVTRPQCLLADEPTGNLDEETSAQVFDSLLEMNREIGTSMVIVTHDRKLAESLDRVMTLRAGQLSEVQQSPTEDETLLCNTA